MKKVSNSLKLLVIGLLLVAPHIPTATSRSVALADKLDDTPGNASDSWVYLPLLNTPNDRSHPPVSARRVNTPYVDPGATEDPLQESAIFWFGQVNRADNYSDVRIRYEANRLVVNVEIFDRLLWYDNSPAPEPSQFESWDMVSLFLHTDPVQTDALTPASFRFNAMVNHYQARENYQATYRGNNARWEIANLGVTTISSWRGDALNNMVEDRGWLVQFNIPYTSLGMASTPREGAIWRLGLIVYDRDAASENAILTSSWPENLQNNQPGTWGELHFGIPRFPAPPAPSSGTVMIRQGLANAVVSDAAVGGTVDNLCPGDADFIWNEWGYANFAGAESSNIQNQANIDDWPCFAKYYVTFPIDQIPPGKTIHSAALILHHWGNSGTRNLAQDSIIHVFSVAEDWREQTLSWNNAPLALENIDRIRIPWVDCTAGTGQMNWPCTPRIWDVGRAVDQAYQQGQPVRLALYSVDTAMHSGKFFTTSETGDWNEAGRPTLVIHYGDP